MLIVQTFHLFQTIFLPAGGVANFPVNHFIVGLVDTVQQYGPSYSHLSIQSEKTPLLPGSQTNHFKEEKVNKLIRSVGEYGTERNQLKQATGITVSPFTDDIFISDAELNRVSVFNSFGQFRHCFQCDCSIRDIVITRAGTLLVTVSSAGNAILREYNVDGQLLSSYGSFYSHEHPFGVALSSKHQPIVTGLRQNCVHVLTSQCKPSVRFGSKGRGQLHFTSPYFVTINHKDQIVVSDCGNNRIKIHNIDGTFVRCFGQQGDKSGELFYPMGICGDKYDNVYVADANNYRVQVFSVDGESLGTPVVDTHVYGIDVKPVNVAFCQENILLVVMRGSKFCQINAYMCDTSKYKRIEGGTWSALWCCCK